MVDGPDLAFVRRFAPLAAGITRYFGAEVAGLERIPEGAALLVGNHNGGSASPDSIIFAFAWLERNHYTELPTSLGHDLIFRVPGVRAIARRLGAVPAAPQHALAAFARGRKVLVYPGGQHESVRPSRDRDRVDFGGRAGYVRLALRAGVPIVPVVAAGAHDGWYVASRGDRLARALPFRRWTRLDVVPLAFGLPTGLLFPLAPHFPLPHKILIEVMAPIAVAGDPDDRAHVQRLSAEVTAAMQSTLDRLVRHLPRSRRARPGG